MTTNSKRICPVCREKTVKVGWRCYDCHMAGLTPRRAANLPKKRGKRARKSDGATLFDRHPH